MPAPRPSVSPGCSVAWFEATGSLVVSGDLDRAGASALVATAGEVADRRPPLVEIDLGGVTFVDSAGWRGVIEALDACFEAGAIAVVSARSVAVDRFTLRARRAAA